MGSDQSNRRGRFDYEKAYAQAANPQRKAAGSRATSSGARQSAAKRAAARKKRRRKKQLRMAALLAAVVIIIAAVIILLVKCNGKNKEPEELIEEGIPHLEVQYRPASVEELYIYGTHLNMTGTLPAEIAELPRVMSVDMVLYNGDFLSVPIRITNDEFTLSEYVNGGLYLDEIPKDTYTMFIRVASDAPFEEETEEIIEETETEKSEQNLQKSDSPEETTARKIQKKKPDEPTTSETSEDDQEAAEGESQEEKIIYYRYYPMQNATDYSETVYYTMSSVGNRIEISSEHEYPTMQMEVAQNRDSDVYDVVIDPGHGGYDAGAIGIDDYCERDFTLPLSLKIKEKLEAAGLKVALTRDNDDNLLEPYGEDGRIARVCKTHAKYMISVHMNSMGAGGLEIYTASGIDYTFAELLRDPAIILSFARPVAL